MTQADSSNPEPTPAAREPFRWRRLLQFKLRTLLFVVIPVCSVFFAWWSYRAHQQRTAVASIKAFGGSVRYDFEENKLDGPPRLPRWLVDAIGVDYFANVENVNLNNAAISDAELSHLSSLTSLQWLMLDGTDVTDVGVEKLKRLTKLRGLGLCRTKVTDTGLEHLKGLTKLTGLWLVGTNVTDAGLEHLRGLTELKQLTLEVIDFHEANDLNLKEPDGPSKLRLHDPWGTNVTDAGVARLKQSLPKCNIDYWPQLKTPSP